jgi:hypothetical protein
MLGSRAAERPVDHWFPVDERFWLMRHYIGSMIVLDAGTPMESRDPRRSVGREFVMGAWNSPKPDI